MKCPKCKDIDLRQAHYKAPLSCSECGGIWILDKGVAKISESILAKTDDASSDNKNVDERTGLCPSGHGIMLRAKVDTEEPFYLEKCSKCGGIWFDDGEWHRLVENHLVENLSDFWTLSWQRKQQKEKNRESFLKLNKQLLGEDIFNSIMDLVNSLKDHPEKMRAFALLKQEMVESNDDRP